MLSSTSVESCLLGNWTENIAFVFVLHLERSQKLTLAILDTPVRLNLSSKTRDASLDFSGDQQATLEGGQVIFLKSQNEKVETEEI